MIIRYDSDNSGASSLHERRRWELEAFANPLGFVGKHSRRSA